MPEGFLSSEEYDEQAHQLYNNGDYAGALELLKEGLALYPNAVEPVRPGSATPGSPARSMLGRSARSSGPRRSTPRHEDGLVGLGLGETVLRFGESARGARALPSGGGNGLRRRTSSSC